MSAVKRGCGYRQCGGIYLETKVSRFGTRRVEEFLFDPPLRVDVDQLGISPRGVKLAQDRAGVWHVWDWVGESHYPNVADMIEEIIRHGLSRRVSPKDGLHLLTEQSRLILVHPRGWIDGYQQVWMSAMLDCENGLRCPTSKHPGGSIRVNDNDDMCCGLYWHDLVQADSGLSRVERDAWEAVNGREHRAVIRSMPSFSYHGWKRITAMPVEHAPAAFAAFPIGQITVIRDPVAGEHHDVVEGLAETRPRLPIRLEDE